MRFTRDVGNIIMDLNDVESINLNALGGADAITVNDLSGTDVVQVNIDLGRSRSAARPGTAQPTPSSLTAPTATTTIQVIGNGSSYVVAGLSALVTVDQLRRSHDSSPSTPSAAKTPSTRPRWPPAS